MIVYRVTNKINGKVYIGATTEELESRKSRHEADAQDRSKWSRVLHPVRLYEDMLKFGLDAFKWEVIEDQFEHVSEMRLRQKQLIIEHRSNDPEFGYNGHPRRRPQRISGRKKGATR